MHRILFFVLALGIVGETGVQAYRQPPSPQEMAYLDQEVAAQPDNSRPLQMRGLNYAVLGNKEKAIADFKAAQKLSPNQVRLYWGFGWALFNLDDYASAVTVWEHAAALAQKKHEAGFNTDPQDPDEMNDMHWISYTLAIGYWAQGDKAKAIDYFTIAAKANPRYREHDTFAAETSKWTEKEQDMALLLFDAWKREIDKSPNRLW